MKRVSRATFPIDYVTASYAQQYIEFYRDRRLAQLDEIKAKKAREVTFEDRELLKEIEAELDRFKWLLEALTPPVV